MDTRTEKVVNESKTTPLLHPHKQGNSGNSTGKSSSSDQNIPGGPLDRGSSSLVITIPSGDKRPGESPDNPHDFSNSDQSHLKSSPTESATSKEDPSAEPQKQKNKAGRPKGRKNQPALKVNRQAPAAVAELSYKQSRNTSKLVPDHSGKRMKFDHEPSAQHPDQPTANTTFDDDKCHPVLRLGRVSQ